MLFRNRQSTISRAGDSHRLRESAIFCPIADSVLRDFQARQLAKLSESFLDQFEGEGKRRQNSFEICR